MECETMVEEVEHMHANGSNLSMRQRHPFATALAWLLGTVATLLSVFYVYMIATVISEWSGYVGGESGTATAILAFFGVITLIAWGVTALAITVARSDR
jgi:hypothetical protein